LILYNEHDPTIRNYAAVTWGPQNITNKTDA
jgi:hypothetical protein